MDQNLVVKLESQIEQLIHACKILQKECNALRAEQARLIEERDSLQTLNHSAAEQIKHIVQRIKTAGVSE